VLLVLTERDDAATPGVRSIGTLRGVTTIRLSRLDEAGVAALAAACRGGAPPAEHELRELMERSDGLPFLVEELLDDRSGWIRVPPTLAELVTRRLVLLSAADRSVIVTAAMIDGDPDWRLLQEVTGAAEGRVLAALRAAVEVGLLVTEDGRLGWRHALTREAVLAGLLPPERAALATRTARALHERAGSGHRAAAADLFIEAGDLQRAAEILVELARSDAAHGALRSAAELLTRAATTGRLAAAVAVERVRVLVLLGRAAEAIEVGEEALATGGVTGDDHAELCLGLARAAVVTGRWPVAERFVERAGSPDDARSMILVADAAFGSGAVVRARPLARAAVDAADRGVPGSGSATRSAAVLCEALMILGRSLSGTDVAASQAAVGRAAQVAAEHGLTPWRVEALFVLGTREYSLGDLQAPSLAAARELGRRAGVLTQVVQADILHADAALVVEGPRAALPLARRAADSAGRLRLSGLQAMAELLAAADAALAGEQSAMTELLAAAGSRAHAPAEVAALAPVVTALPHLMNHDVPRAAELFDQGVTALLPHGSAAPTQWYGLWALLRTAVDDRERSAREVLRVHHTVNAAVNRAALAYADAIAAGRDGRPDEAVARFGDAGASIARLPWWNRLLRLLALEAAAGAPTRRRGGAHVPPALRALGITGREAEVLTLVATGLTNAQAAERLFLSPRTVDTHVARLLAKTGAADRAGLRRWAAALDGVPLRQ
jgi:DNA-binding CsgD family transcriptional regulator